jgi:hypothetical protein
MPLDDGYFWAKEARIKIRSFVASTFCYEIEMARSLERNRTENVKVIPILLRPTADWESTDRTFGSQWKVTPRAFMLWYSPRQSSTARPKRGKLPSCLPTRARSASFSALWRTTATCGLQEERGATLFA